MRLSELMSGMKLSTYTEIAMVIFIVVFVGVCFYTARRGNSAMFERASEFPLADDAPVTPGTGHQS